MYIGAQIIGYVIGIVLFYILYKLFKLVILKVFVTKEKQNTDDDYGGLNTVDLISGLLAALAIGFGLILFELNY